MKHLIKFELVRELRNIESTNLFRQSFSVRIVSRSEQIYTSECLIEVELDDKTKYMFELQLKNKVNKNIYVFVYYLSSCWQVEDILRESYEVIPSQNNDLNFTGMFRKKLKTSISFNIRKGDCHFEDIIKVFVISQSTSFDFLELSKLGGPLEKNATSRTSREVDNHSSEDWAALNFRVRTYFSHPA